MLHAASQELQHHLFPWEGLRGSEVPPLHPPPAASATLSHATLVPTPVPTPMPVPAERPSPRTRPAGTERGGGEGPCPGERLQAG